MRYSKKWHSLKSGSETRDPGPCDPGPETWDPETRDPRPWDPAPWDSGAWNTDTQEPGNGTPKLATDPTTDCINFICEANFDSKKLGHVCQKRRGSNTEIKFRGVFFSFSCQKQVNHVPNLYFCCILYLIVASSRLITFEKIKTFIFQSKKQDLTFKLDNF